DHDEAYGIDDVRGGQRAKVDDEEEAEQKAKQRRQKTGAPAAVRRGDQNRRQEEEIEGVTAQQKKRLQQEIEPQRQRKGRYRNAVALHDAMQKRDLQTVPRGGRLQLRHRFSHCQDITVKAAIVRQSADNSQRMQSTATARGPPPKGNYVYVVYLNFSPGARRLAIPDDEFWRSCAMLTQTAIRSEAFRVVPNSRPLPPVLRPAGRPAYANRGEANSLDESLQLMGATMSYPRNTE